MGKQGTGKNTFIDPIGKLFGAHYLPLDNIQQLLGQFNFHLKNAALIHANEAVWGGNRKELGVLKAMVTDEYSVIEGKGKDRIVVRNFKHVIISSNEDWPVALDHDDRRFLVLRVSDARKEDIPYFKAIQEQLKSGGLQALLYDLLNEPISDFDPRIIPQNTEAFDVKLMSAPTADRYIYEALCAGCFDVGNMAPCMDWLRTVGTESLYSDYCAWCDRQDITREGKERLGKALTRLIPSSVKTRPRLEEGRQRQYEFPDLLRAREEFQKAYKVGPSIWES